MIAADSSAWIDFLSGTSSPESTTLEAALEEGLLVLPTPVFFELLSAPGLNTASAKIFEELPRLSLEDEAWERAAGLRRKILQEGKKARSMDCLIAQNCIDHKTALIARDRDFRHFAAHGLKLHR